MRRIILCAASTLLLGALAPGPAAAREDFCLNANGSVNKTATRGYRKIEDDRNENLMRRIHGVWFNQTRNPFTGQISHMWEYYEGRPRSRAGLYAYCNIVCDANNQFCSRFQGVGLWAVQGKATKFNGMRIVSDLQRDHFCQILEGRISNNNDIWTSPGGGQSVRVAPPQNCPPLQ
ncbi:hypothetical protein [Hansschlegelia zhihuaiae]|uniref:DUF2147 domain-containing protein n=1 Tax=Hansschlegelia zhihuaiae TaxID=405005 RepID=A0A4Q0MKN4_9HYPH|nr:hypothetical protein [Hansschlegelia zhihuaiae]RXF74065.1 hypothetical protein EK403_06745 [Hansschlegelia zhihuaiae]